MEQPFSKQLCELADNMGIALYQRFTVTEASLFLRCQIGELERLISKRKIEYIQLPNQADFFGYQLIDYLLNNIQVKNTSLSPVQSSTERIVSSKEVQELTGLSRTTIWRLERNGEFPARVQLSSTRIGWRFTEVQEWIRLC